MQFTYVRSQHDGRLLGGCKRHNLDVPGVRGHGVGNVAHDLTGEALLAVGIDNREGDGVFGMRHNSKVAVIPSIWSTVQGVVVVVLVGLDEELLAIDGKGRVPNAIGVTTGHTTQMGVNLALVSSRVVEAENNVALNTVLAHDEQVGDGRAIWDEVTANALRRDLVLAVLVRSGRARVGRRGAVLREGSRSKEGECT